MSGRTFGARLGLSGPFEGHAGGAWSYPLPLLPHLRRSKFSSLAYKHVMSSRWISVGPLRCASTSTRTMALQTLQVMSYPQVRACDMYVLSSTFSPPISLYHHVSLCTEGSCTSRTAGHRSHGRPHTVSVATRTLVPLHGPTRSHAKSSSRGQAQLSRRCGQSNLQALLRMVLPCRSRRM